MMSGLFFKPYFVIHHASTSASTCAVALCAVYKKRPVRKDPLAPGHSRAASRSRSATWPAMDARSRVQPCDVSRQELICWAISEREAMLGAPYWSAMRNGNVSCRRAPKRRKSSTQAREAAPPTTTAGVVMACVHPQLGSLLYIVNGVSDFLDNCGKWTLDCYRF